MRLQADAENALDGDEYEDDHESDEDEDDDDVDIFGFRSSTKMRSGMESV